MKRFPVLPAAAITLVSAALLVTSPAVAAPSALAPIPVPVRAAPAPSPMAAPAVSATGRTSLRVSWRDADADGALGVTGYTVTVTRGATTVRTTDVAAHATSAAVTGLHLGRTYRVTIREVLGASSSPASPATTIALKTPKRPAKPHVTATSTSAVRVTWKAPASSGGPAGTTYQVRILHGGTVVQLRTVTAAHHSATLTGLHSSTRYAVAVRAANGVGYGLLSAKAAVTTKRPSAVVRWAAKHYGTFASRTYHGTGDDVITLPAHAKAGLVIASTDGADNFVLETLTSKNEMDELLVNEIGSYSGTTAFGVSEHTTTRRIQVTADGDWTITVRPVSSAHGITGSHESDGVYLYGGRAATLRLTNSGHDNFVVWQWGSPSGDDLLVNEIGAFTGSRAIYRGPSVLTVESDGHWTAKAR